MCAYLHTHMLMHLCMCACVCGYLHTHMLTGLRYVCVCVLTYASAGVHACLCLDIGLSSRSGQCKLLDVQSSNDKDCMHTHEQTKTHT